TANVSARYIAPVSSTSRPSRAATPRDTVDFPEPEGPSMATIGSAVIPTIAESREIGEEVGIRHLDRRPAPYRRVGLDRLPRDGRRHGDAVVTVTLHQSRLRAPAANHQAVG